MLAQREPRALQIGEVEQAVPDDEVQRAEECPYAQGPVRKAAEAMSKEMGMYTSEEVTRPGA